MTDEILFAKLLHVVDTLLGPDGCQWDQKQTLDTLRQSVLEETCELIDTIEEKDSKKMNEELGDLLFNVIFLAKVAAKEGHFTLSDTLKTLTDKLIYRHPHVFGEKKMDSLEDIVSQWEELKKKEREKSKSKSALDGIPKTLPALARALKVIEKIKRAKYRDTPTREEINWEDPTLSEDALGKWLFDVVRRADQRGLDPEFALRRYLTVKEKEFRDWEAGNR